MRGASDSAEPGSEGVSAAGVRRTELAEALRRVRGRIDAACAAAGRHPSSVRMLAVTKTFPAADVAHLIDLGLTEFGENRDQEASAKAVELAGLRPVHAICWHMVGTVQRNKTRSIVRWAAEVQSVDSLRLADALARASDTAIGDGVRTVPLDVLLQVSLDGDPDRGGCAIPRIPELAERVTQLGGLRFRGLMTVAPLGIEPEKVFAQLAEVAERLRGDYQDATELSAGMSDDLETAIAHGSTCVRVGTALLGRRKLASPDEGPR